MNRRGLAWIAVALLALPSAAAAQDGAAPSPPEPAFFARHRAEFMERMGGGIAILTAQPEIPRNDDAAYPYRQDSDFYYLTGFTEPEAMAILRPEAPAGERYALFVRPRDPEQEVWTGHRAGVEGAIGTYGADRAWVIDSVDAVLARWMDGTGRVYFDFSKDHPWSQLQRVEWLNAWADSTRIEILGTDAILDEMRLIKSPAEIALLQRAVDVTVDAHRAAMAALRPGMHEYELQAVIEYVFRVQGSPRVGFNSIIGSGPNATILHYEANDRRMEADDMVVMDIGAEWAYYTADVTRTIPVDGAFSAEERAIYQLVLDAQNAAMAIIEPNVTTIRDVHRRATEVVVEGLIREGLLTGTLAENLESGAYERFFMHGTSHWLGLDVHDVGGYLEPPGTDRARSRVLRPGMVFSVEPGIYVADGTAGVDPRWWDIGVRIEDDVVVTADGWRNMSADAPREIAEIEALMVGRGVPLDDRPPGLCLRSLRSVFR